MAEKDTSTLLIFKNQLGSGCMAQWLVPHFFAGGSWNAGSNPAVASSSFFFLSSSFYLLAFYCLFSLLTLLASRDFCENVFLVTQAYHSRCTENYQVRPESLQTFQRSYASSKVKNENDAIPKLTSDVFLNQKPNKQSKQTSHE